MPTLSLKSRDIDYINVPLTLRYHADGLFFEAGPEANFAIKAVNEAGADVKSNDVTPVTLNYVVGLGYELPMGLSANIRYDGGISRTYKTTAANGLGRWQPARQHLLVRAGLRLWRQQITQPIDQQHAKARFPLQKPGFFSLSANYSFF